jgi:hypothetical protein
VTWDELRYARLLPATTASLRFGGAYATLVAAVEGRRNPERSVVAERRLRAWLDLPPVAARRIFRRCLWSEAREEADAAFFMQRPGAALAAAFASSLPVPMAEGPVLYVGLHLGSPVLGYVHLATGAVPDLALIARGLDPANPLADAKRRFAVAKVAWTEARAGRPFFATDGASMLGVRAHLRAGKPLYLLADVPGDTVGRAEACHLFGERVRVGAGLPTLARIAASPVQTLAVTRDARGFALRLGPRLEAGAVSMPAVLDALAPFIRAHADQWWMWPYLPTAD